ncbi:hypothetical protein FG379_000823 [Cryptosporidium bovis]|uniref:uncharacterized protein n=1 Tax=Cryptosporidium bovis TaxID=310047 RepID=UPI003519F6D6|nr:hypothetical protein FG379_000823 [Cryptosporidium bovis]
MTLKNNEDDAKDVIKWQNKKKNSLDEQDNPQKSVSGKLTDLCTLDLSKETSSLQLPNAFSKLMQITKQLQNELRMTRKERDEAYNSLILQRDYYEQSATSKNISKNKLDNHFDTEYVS